jgi:D-aspartate ligase
VVLPLMSGKTNPAVVLGVNGNALGTIRSLASADIPVIAVDFRPHHSDPLIWASARTRLADKVWMRRPGTWDSATLVATLAESLVDLGRRLETKGVLFPSHDWHVRCLAQHAAMLRPWYHFVIPQDSVLSLLSDKALFYDFAARTGFDIPRTFLPEGLADIERIARQARYPCIIKPPISDETWGAHASGQKVLVQRSSEELVATFRRLGALHSRLIVQEVVPGPDRQLIFSHTYFGRDSIPLAIWTGRKLRQWPIRFGNSSLTEGIDDSEARRITIDLLTQVKYAGYASVEFKKDLRDQTYRIMEVTAGRTWYPHYLGTASGVNLPVIWYNDLLGREPPGEVTFTKGFKWVDEYHDVFAAWAYWKEGDLSFGAWVQSYRGRKCFVVSSWRDPLPVLFLAFRIAVIGLGNAIVTRVPVLDRITRSVLSLLARRWRPPRSGLNKPWQ